MGAKLAASGPAAHDRRTVPGDVLGRIVAGATVYCPRHRPRTVRGAGAGRAVSAAPVSLAEPRRGAEPARPRHRHPPSSGNGAHRYARDPGSGGAGAVAGATPTHFGIAQTHPRRLSVAAASLPRSLGAA